MPHFPVGPDELGRLLFETSSDGVVLLAEDGSPRLMNEAAREMGPAIAAALHDDADEDVRRFRHELSARGRATTEITIGDGESGASRTFVVSGRRLGVEAVLFVHEVSARARVEERLAALGQFAGGVAHDFNNLLTPIAYLSHELVQELVDGSRAHALAAELDALTGRGAALVKQLLAFIRREPTEPHPIAVGRVVEELTPLLARLVGATISLSVHVEDDGGESLVDRVHLERAVLNLVANARDAIVDAGRIVLRTSSVLIGYTPEGTAAALPQGSYVALTVVDDGVGMPSHVRERALDRFFTTKGPGGTGLGLTNVQRFAAKSGGAVAIRSEPGEGTAVTIYLPRFPRPQPAIEDDAPVLVERSGCPAT